jgi:hypothetical protein
MSSFLWMTKPAILALLVLSSCTTAAPTWSAQPGGIDYSSADWDDMSVYLENLAPSEQNVLPNLKGASIYRMDIRIASNYLSLEGHEKVFYTNRENVSLDSIYFQLFPSMSGGHTGVKDITVDGESASWGYEFNGGALRVDLPFVLPPGKSVILGMDFSVDIPDTPGGYGIFGYTGGILALNSFYPAIPVFDDSGWHVGPYPANADNTFQDAGFYLVKVDAPQETTLVGSGSVIARVNKGVDQTVIYAAGPARDFYLAASKNYTLVRRKAGLTTISCYILPGDEVGAEAALDIATAAIQDYSSRMGNYPYTKLDIVPLELSGALGIEYPGVMGISSELFSKLQELETTIAHELAHQWFYNIVGNDQINEPWLDEAMAQYCTGLYYLDSYGEVAWQMLEQSWAARWDRVGRADIPIGLTAGEYSGREYGAIIYGRGPLFIEVLAQYMGPEKFAIFLTDYCKSNRWQVVDGAVFQALAERYCQCDLSAVFNEWVKS